MTESTAPEQGIQAGGAPAAAPDTALQAAPPVPDIPLPPMPPAPVLAPIARGWSAFDAFLLVLLATLAFFFGSFTANNSDFWMHLATGRDLINGTHQLGVDPYSFATTSDSHPVRWVNHSWLYDVGLYCLYQAVGGPGVVILHALLGVALVLILVSFCAPESSRPATVLMAGLIMLVVSHRMPLNSVLVSYLLFGVLLALLRRGGALGDEETPSRRALWSVPILFAVWVNLDGWFILGLCALVLIVVGNAASAFLGRHRSAANQQQTWLAVRQQALLLLASCAACLVNPFHIHAFTLPPELAYALGNWLPGALGAGGDTLRSLAQIDPDSLAGSGYGRPFLAPFAPFTAMSFTIDKAAFFVLAALVVLSVPLVLVAAASDYGPRLPLGRLLVLAGITALGLMQVRLISLFAVLAGPIAMLNFTDFTQWLRRRPDVNPQGGFNPNLARLATGVLLVLAVVLAWPGWVHGRIMGNSYRRVAWEVLEDPSLKAAALSLQGQAKRVFNLHPDIANYCAWFAPGVRCYHDQRHALYVHEAARFARTKKALREDASLVLEDTRKAPRGEWLEVFRTHQIDHLAISRFTTDSTSRGIGGMCWWRATQWTQSFGDGFCLVFRWAPDGRADSMALAAKLNQQAFGAVPEAERAPRDGVEPVQPVPTLQELYLARIPPLAGRAGDEAVMYYLYHKTVHGRWMTVYEPAWWASLWSVPGGLNGAAPTSVTYFPTVFFTLASQTRQVHPRDFGPPAAPMLMIREARRAVKEHPQEPSGYRALYLAYKTQAQEMEEYWAGESKTDRYRIRHVQLISALRTYLELNPDDWNSRMELAIFYNRERLLDAGLEQVGLALRSVEKERRLARDARTLDALKQTEKGIADFHKRIELDVKRRRNDFDIQAGKKKPLEKFVLAVLKEYKTVNQMNQDEFESTGMGLALEGLKQLDSIPPGSLSAQEQTVAQFQRLRLLLLLGQVREANEASKELQPSPETDRAVLWYAAAVGDYELADSMLGRMVKSIELEPSPDPGRTKFIASAVGRFAGINVAAELPAAARALCVNFSDMPIVLTLNEYRRGLQIASDRASWRTMRGVFALEVGDTARAEQHFTQALRDAGPDVAFADRPIAQRYLDLLREQKK